MQFVHIKITQLVKLIGFTACEMMNWVTACEFSERRITEKGLTSFAMRSTKDRLREPYNATDPSNN